AVFFYNKLYQQPALYFSIDRDLWVFVILTNKLIKTRHTTHWLRGNLYREECGCIGRLTAVGKLIQVFISRQGFSSRSGFGGWRRFDNRLGRLKSKGNNNDGDQQQQACSHRWF